MTKEETINYPDGNKYVGEVSDGVPNGQGVMTYADDSTYVGEWKDGEVWEGTETDKDGKVTATYSEGVETEN